MNTEHKVFFQNAQNMSQVSDSSVDLVITSPPYPMIEMWDDIMSAQNPNIKTAFDGNKPGVAFELMHRELDKVWAECYRVLKAGGFLCINIGDATRTINGDFELYNNHSRILQYCTSIGFTNLPNVIWRKQTNAPNKFMGSGMLPCGAYITLEHEHILVFRKGTKRNYKTEQDKAIRRQSSFFWEERNIWFSDVWELKGTKQKIDKSMSRERSAAFPMEIPYRIINMYSQIGDTILDPFMGTGTTSKASILLGRNSIGYEIDSAMTSIIKDNICSSDIYELNAAIKARYDKHLLFVQERSATHGALKYQNQYLGCDVMTSQETELEFHYIKSIYEQSSQTLTFFAEYEEKSDLKIIPRREDSLF